jgi:hypothetical protein
MKKTTETPTNVVVANQVDAIVMRGIIHDLEYAAYNLCEKTDSDVERGVIESTCPEASLLLSIRRLKEMT